MIKKVLFVDDDRILCRLIHKKFEKHENIFSTITAVNGLDAIEKLKNNAISLVVTDLQMPEMDGFALLAHLSKKYPDIPVIIQTGHRNPKLKTIAIKGGAADYIEKPFKVEELGEKIITTLKKESEGGILQTISLEMFIQLVEMEQKTCTIRIVEKHSQNSGVLFFKNGELLDARFLENQGKLAAYEIFSWDEVMLSIQDNCPINNKRINEDLQAILFDAMRLKDEAGEDKGAFLGEIYDDDVEKIPSDESPEDTLSDNVKIEQEIIKSASRALLPENIIMEKLNKEPKINKYLKKIYRDDSWNDFIFQVSEIGKYFRAGKLKLCYIDRGKQTDYVLMPGYNNLIISVDSQCPRDKFMQTLIEN